MNKQNKVENILDDDESLAIFLRAMGKFDRSFCELLIGGDDFTLRMEIHGNKGKMIHCRVHSDSFERPKNASQSKL